MSKNYWVTHKGEVVAFFSRYGAASTYLEEDLLSDGKILFHDPNTGKLHVYGWPNIDFKIKAVRKRG